MKKTILFTFFVLAAFHATAQNWSPIRVNQKMNYRRSDSLYISHTIWVDSIQLLLDDSIFHLNRVVKDLPGNPEIVLRNQPQFFKKTIKKMGNSGLYRFGDPGKYYLHSRANLGDTWIFDSAWMLSATVIEVSIMNLFGIPDSVKTIDLATGSENTIRLSKNFGIIEFPDLTDESVYILAGIQGTPVGESIPDFWAIFNWEVGDVFEYNNYFMEAMGDAYTTRKITIDSELITGDQVQFDFHGIEHTTYFNAGGGGCSYSNYITGSITYFDSINHPANTFPSQLYRLPDSWSGFGTQRVFTHAKVFFDPELLVISKQFGVRDNFFNLFEADLYYETDGTSDTLYRFPEITLIGDPCGRKGHGFGNTTGEIFSTEGCFEIAVKRRLVGYIKEGDTVGNITPDSVLMPVGISENTIPSGKVSVCPNPASEFIRLSGISEPQTEFVHLGLMNLTGQSVKSTGGYCSEDFIIDVGDLKQGIYLFEIRTGNQVIERGKLLIR